MKNAMQFLREVKHELTKVVWPKPDEFIGSTIVVLLLVCVFAIYLGALDIALNEITKYVLKMYGGY
jgi:preprotein translocase SecE subunit